MVDPNVKRELQPECVVPSVKKKKPSIEKSTYIPSLVKKKLHNLPFQIASVYQYIYICTLVTKHTFNASNF